jgi:hypothetical protein
MLVIIIATGAAALAGFCAGYLARRARRPAPAADIVIRVDCDTSEAVAALKRLRDDVIAAGEEASR